MKERNIPYSAPMVRARNESRKTQTRRTRGLKKINQAPDDWLLVETGILHGKDSALIAQFRHKLTGDILYIPCPYGKAGDRLWIRETCRAEELPNGTDGVRYLADGAFREIENTREAADAWVALNWYRGKRGQTVPPIHMPRWASRGLDEVVNIRVERLQGIREVDAVAEGCDVPLYIGDGVGNMVPPPGHTMATSYPSARHWYASLWESINGPGSWDANPWVWVIEFKVVKP